MSLRNAFENLATEAKQDGLLSVMQDAYESTDGVLSDALPRNGDEPVTLVVMHPDYPITIDPGQVLPVGGMTKGGVVRMHLADVNGAQILSDAPQQLQGVGINVTGQSILAFTDTQGYQSISVQLYGTWAGTVSFYSSNDSSTWVPTAGYSAASGGAPLVSTTTVGLYTLPCLGRYFKAQVTTYTSGTFLCSSFLRMQPAPQLLSTPTVSATVSSGQAAHAASVAGNPMRLAGRAVSAPYAAVATGQVADFVTTLMGSLVTRLNSIPENDFQASDTITNTTTSVQVKAATASNKNYITGVQITTAALSGATVLQLRDVPIASTSATIASNTLVMSATYNWKVGDIVYVTASTVTGLTAGSYYYLLTVSTTSLTFSATRGGSTMVISGTTVSATLAHVLHRITLQTTALPVTVLEFPTALQSGTGLGVEMTTLTAVTGAVDFNVQGYVAA